MCTLRSTQYETIPSHIDHKTPYLSSGPLTSSFHMLRTGARAILHTQRRIPASSCTQNQLLLCLAYTLMHMHMAAPPYSGVGAHPLDRTNTVVYPTYSSYDMSPVQLTRLGIPLMSLSGRVVRPSSQAFCLRMLSSCFAFALFVSYPFIDALQRPEIRTWLRFCAHK